MSYSEALAQVVEKAAAAKHLMFMKVNGLQAPQQHCVWGCRATGCEAQFSWEKGKGLIMAIVHTVLEDDAASTSTAKTASSRTTSTNNVRKSRSCLFFQGQHITDLNDVLRQNGQGSQMLPLIRRRRWLKAQQTIVYDAVEEMLRGSKKWKAEDYERLQKKLGDTPNLRNKVYTIRRMLEKVSQQLQHSHGGKENDD